MAEITLVDTNIILPESTWELYKRQLNQYTHQLSTTTPSHLTNNIAINPEKLFAAIEDLIATYALLQDKPRVKVVKGVATQVKKQTDMILGNIDERKLDYSYTQFYQLINETKKNENRHAYETLLRYAEELKKMVELVRKSRYTRKDGDGPYYLLSNLVRAIKEEYDVVKEGHKHDLGTDDELVTTALHESLVKGTRVQVISNDRDISNMIAASQTVFDNLRILVAKNPAFKKFYEHPISVLTLENPQEKITQTANLTEIGKKVIKIHIPEAQIPIYQRRTSAFSTFAVNTLEELVKAIK